MENQNHQAIDQLAAALSKAQGEFPTIPKSRTVTIRPRKEGASPYTFSYADLATILDCVRPALAKNGLSVSQMIESDTLVCVLMHASGQKIESRLPLGRIGNDDIKTFGAYLTYLRRYQISAMLCVAADDDQDEDGEESAPPKPPARQAQQRPAPRPQVAPPAAPPAAADQSVPEQPTQIAGGLTDGMQKNLRASLAKAGKSEADCCAHFGVGGLHEIPMKRVNEALQWAKA